MPACMAMRNLRARRRLSRRAALAYGLQQGPGSLKIAAGVAKKSQSGV